MSRSFKYLPGWFLVYLLINPAMIYSQPADAAPQKVNLLKYSRIIAEPDSGYDPEKLEQMPFATASEDNELVSFGFSDTAYLFLLTLNNPETKPLPRLLVFNPTWLDSVQVVLVDPDGARHNFTGGDFLDFNVRSVAHRNSNFELLLKPGTSRLLIRTQTVDPYLVQLTLWEKSAFFADDSRQMIYTGFIYGVLIAMLLYNLVLFFSIQETVYLAYVGYLSFFILGHSAYNGYLFSLLFSDFPEINNWAHSVFIYLYVMSGLLFAASFLELRNKLVKYYQWTAGLVAVIALSFVITAAWGGYSLHIRSAILWVFVYAPFVLFAGFGSLISGNRAARYFLTAAIAGFIGSFITASTVTGLISFTFLRYHAVDLGMVVDAILLSIALADRLRLARGEAEKAKNKLVDFTRSHAETLKTEIAERTSELEKLNRQLTELSLIDALTGVGNRRQLDEFLEKEWLRHMRNQKPLSLLICDVDFFKQFNDHYGHQAGDECLKTIALTLKRVVTRPADLIARFGGEEFAVVLPDTDKGGAFHVAENIRREIELLKINHPGSHHGNSVTISIGVAGFVPDETSSTGTLIRQADSALYEAKKHGRNKVVGDIS